MEVGVVKRKKKRQRPVSMIPESLREYPKAMLEAIATHEVLRTLGFTSDQIFMHRNPPPGHEIVVVLRHTGKQLATMCGPYEKPDWEEQWIRAATDFNSQKIPEDDFQKWYREGSWIFQNKAQLLVVMHSKGIEPPYRMD